MPKKAFTTEEYVAKATELHNNKYDYTKTVYKNSTTHITVTCPLHGDFTILPSNHTRVFRRPDKSHLKPCGCPACGRDAVSDRNVAGRKPIEQFIKEANEVHSFKYDYSKVEYKRNNIKIEVVCPDHGSFFPLPTNHLRGTGCPKCKNSKGETRIAKILSKKGIRYYQEHTFEDCVGDTNAPLRFDFFIPHKNLLIEYDGEQHFAPVRFHKNMSMEVATKMFEQTRRYDSIKDMYAKDNNINLVRIPYNKINNVEHILQEVL